MLLGIGVEVGVTVADGVGLFVGVDVLVAVIGILDVGVFDGWGVFVGVLVDVLVAVGALVGVLVAVGVLVGVLVGVFRRPMLRGSQTGSTVSAGAAALAISGQGISLKFWLPMSFLPS